MMIKKTLIAAATAMLAFSSLTLAGPRGVTQCAVEGADCALGGGVKQIEIGYYGDGTNPQFFVSVETPGGGTKTMPCDRDALGVADEFSDYSGTLICRY